MSAAISEIIGFVKKELVDCYDNVEYCGVWRGYDAYSPFRNDGERIVVGGPFIVLVQGDTIRMATEDEAFTFLDEVYPNPEDPVTA